MSELTKHYDKEIKYYKEEVEELRQIIKQLIDGPGEFTYIHPFDLHELINKPGSYVELFKHADSGISTGNIVIIGDKKYIQTVNIPAKTKQIS